jgi:translation initiation factor 3 subunit A
MDTESLRRLQLIQLDKERGELSEKLRQTGKRIDHFERALRREEIPLLNQDYETQLAHEKEKYEENKRQKLIAAAERHKEILQLKKRLERIMPEYQTYREIIKEKRSEEFQARENEARQALEAEKARRRAQFKKQQEELRRAEEERIRREEEEEERLRQEEEERFEKEEAARREAEEKAQKREEERRYGFLSFYIHELTSFV